MLDPRTVMVGVPCHDGRLMTELSGMLIANKDLYAAITMPTECSHPSLVRNIMADTFLRSGLDWFVGIDSDIVPARADFEFLLQPTDVDGLYAPEGETDPNAIHFTVPTPTRIEARLLPDALTQATLSQQRALCDVLVCCEYAYKRDTFEPVQFGGGFYRVHKSVFSMLANLQHPPGDTVSVSRAALKALQDMREDTRELNDVDYPRSAVEAVLDSVSDSAGTPRLWQCTYGGRMFYDFFPSGAMLSAGLPHGDWKGEDHGFWTLCALAGLVPRIERRTRLIHIGRKGYPYLGPDEGGGQ